MSYDAAKTPLHSSPAGLCVKLRSAVQCRLQGGVVGCGDWGAAAGRVITSKSLISGYLSSLS